MSSNLLSKEVLDSLYTLNKLAKNYSNSSKTAYNNGFGAEAKYLSIRKKALYAYKSYILQELYNRDLIEKIEKHSINNRTYYCFIIGDHSFHIPTEEVKITEEIGEIIDITGEFSSTAKSLEDLPFKEIKALENLDEKFEKSPNHFLSQQFVSDYTQKYAGWKLLSGSSSIGEKVEKNRVDESFLFNIGDEFETETGRVEIIERYGIIRPGYSPHNNQIKKRPAYKAKVNGEFKDLIQEKLVREYPIYLQTTDNPSNIYSLSGNLWTNFLQKELEEREPVAVGDTLMIPTVNNSEEEAEISKIEVYDCKLMVSLVFEDGYEEKFQLEVLMNKIISKN